MTTPPLEQFDESAVAPTNVAPLTAGEFERIAALARKICGLELKEGKEPMVSSRLMRHARGLHCRTFSEYYRKVTQDESGDALGIMIDALTTNFTSFMREQAHFDFLKSTVFPTLRGRDRITLWSAGTATGEEAYSLTLSMLDFFGDAAASTLHLLATDISHRALQTAERAAYQSERLKTIDPVWHRKYFLRGQDQWKGWYRVKPEVRKLIEFRQLNFMEPFPKIGPFPVIFCRNVMIYFDRPTQLAIVKNFADHLEPGGYLMIGHSESLAGLECGLDYVRPAVYRKAPTGRQWVKP